jgi:hypothetical protein
MLALLLFALATTAGTAVWYVNRPESLPNFLLQWMVVIAITSPAIAMLMLTAQDIPSAFEDRPLETDDHAD